MLGRKTYTQEELDNGRSAIKAQLAAHKKLAKAAAGSPAAAALDTFDAALFNNLVMALDRFYVHRIRPVTGKDTNPLNEVELIVESLLNHGGVFTPGKVIKYVPEKSVLKLEAGEKIALTSTQFDQLSSAFFTELEARFVET